MYNHFFGFREKPFKLVPNPDYLFLSRCHEEALAHLTYAVSEGEGFVELIGVVGTGKTMLCRAFLNNLGDDTETAYIFNPKMDAADLLRAVNNEFGIFSAPDATAGNLIDALNAFLMEKKREGKRAVLLIDEAQNLSREVLEQVRLLSNLETSKEKLLQIILAGQPELGEMLDSYELRQLGQRITLSCRLRPLTLAETGQYIRHRLHVASRKEKTVFSWSAVWKIHRYSGGIPRLINIACDRALLAAYGGNRRTVNGRIARKAILELSSRGQRNRAAARFRPVYALAAGLCGAALVLVWVYQSEIRTVLADMPFPKTMFSSIYPEKKDAPAPVAKAGPQAAAEPGQKAPEAGITPAPQPEKRPPAAQAASGPVEPAPARNIDKEETNLQEALQDADMQGSRAQSMAVLLDQWGIAGHIPPGLSEIKDQASFFSLAARQNGLSSYSIRGDLSLIRNLNVCAILEFIRPEAAAPVYLTAVSASENAMIFVDGAGRWISALNEDIGRCWTGRAFVFWKNFYHYPGIIPRAAPRESIVALKLQLRKIGYDRVGIDADYDKNTVSAVKDLQARNGIPVDGYVGPLTQIVLYNIDSAFHIPHLRGDETEAAKADRMHPEGRNARAGVGNIKNGSPG